MWKAFNQREKLAIVGGFLFCVLYGVVVQVLGTGSGAGEFWYRFTQWGPLGVASLFGLYTVVRVSEDIRGRLGRALSVAGVGYVVFAILSVPHAAWHGEGTHPGFFGMGLSVGGLEIIFHGGTAILSLFIAYGFYLAYRSAKTTGGVTA